MPPPAPLLVAVDGNSLLHRAHHGWAADAGLDATGKPVWGLRGLVISIAAAAARLRPDAVLVGFDCTEHSVRKAAFPAYKAHRPDKPDDLQSQLQDAPDLLRTAGFPVVTSPGHEADDVLASAAALARRDGWRAVLVTSDRDSFALVDDAVSVLRVINGGIDGSPILTPAAVLSAYHVTPAQYPDFAALRGDPSDNLRGVFGVGAATAAKLLHAFPTLDAALAAVDERPDAVAGVVGEAVARTLADPTQRRALARTRGLMAMHANLPLPALDDMRLPLDRDRIRTALAQRDIVLGPSLWALVGGPEPTWSPNGFDKAPTFLPRVTAPPWAASEWARTRAESGADDASATAADPARPGARRPARKPHPVLAGQLTLF